LDALCVLDQGIVLASEEFSQYEKTSRVVRYNGFEQSDGVRDSFARLENCLMRHSAQVAAQLAVAGSPKGKTSVDLYREVAAFHRGQPNFTFIVDDMQNSHPGGINFYEWQVWKNPKCLTEKVENIGCFMTADHTSGSGHPRWSLAGEFRFWGIERLSERTCIVGKRKRSKRTGKWRAYVLTEMGYAPTWLQADEDDERWTIVGLSDSVTTARLAESLEGLADEQFTTE